MKTTSDTPETDKFAFGYAVKVPQKNGGGTEVRLPSHSEWTGFARKLERERNAALEEVKRLNWLLRAETEKQREANEFEAVSAENKPAPSKSLGRS